MAKVLDRVPGYWKNIAGWLACALFGGAAFAGYQSFTGVVTEAEVEKKIDERFKQQTELIRAEIKTSLKGLVTADDVGSAIVRAIDKHSETPHGVTGELIAKQSQNTITRYEWNAQVSRMDRIEAKLDRVLEKLLERE